MTGKSKQELNTWLTSKAAADIMTTNSGHEIKPEYVRLMGRKGKIEVMQLDERTNLYSRKDVEAYTVKKKGDGSIRRAARAPRVTTP